MALASHSRARRRSLGAGSAPRGGANPAAGGPVDGCCLMPESGVEMSRRALGMLMLDLFSLIAQRFA